MSDDKSDAITFLSIIKSVLAAAFGVQSRRNRERDFSKGNIWVFIVAGIFFTVLFVVTVAMIVHAVLASAQS